MGMIDTFHCRNTAVGSLTWLAIFASFGMLISAILEPNPLFMWGVVAPCLPFCVWQMAVRPVYGLQLSPQVLHIFDGYAERTYPLHRIAHLVVVEAEDPKNFTLVMTDGAEIVLPTQSMPKPLTLIKEANDRGIPVRYALN